MENFYEAFEKYIKGQKVVSPASYAPYGNRNIPDDQRYYGDGMVFENGYMILYHGGGCSGEDCNTTFIVDGKGKLIARNDW